MYHRLQRDSPPADAPTVSSRRVGRDEWRGGSIFLVTETTSGVFDTAGMSEALAAEFVAAVKKIRHGSDLLTTATACIPKLLELMKSRASAAAYNASTEGTQNGPPTPTTICRIINSAIQMPWAAELVGLWDKFRATAATAVPDKVAPANSFLLCAHLASLPASPGDKSAGCVGAAFKE